MKVHFLLYTQQLERKRNLQCVANLQCTLMHIVPLNVHMQLWGNEFNNIFTMKVLQ